MIKTIKELLIEWWAGNLTTKMPLPIIYIYEVEVDGKTITIESISRSRIYIHYKARKKYPAYRSNCRLKISHWASIGQIAG